MHNSIWFLSLREIVFAGRFMAFTFKFEKCTTRPVKKQYYGYAQYQGFQVSGISRETHEFRPFLTVSQRE